MNALLGDFARTVGATALGGTPLEDLLRNLGFQNFWDKAGRGRGGNVVTPPKQPSAAEAWVGRELKQLESEYQDSPDPAKSARRALAIELNAADVGINADDPEVRRRSRARPEILPPLDREHPEKNFGRDEALRALNTSFSPPEGKKPTAR